MVLAMPPHPSPGHSDPGALPVLLLPDEAAALLRCNRATVYRRVEEGVLPAYRRAGRVLIPRAALLDHIATHTTSHA